MTLSVEVLESELAALAPATPRPRASATCLLISAVKRKVNSPRPGRILSFGGRCRFCWARQANSPASS